MARKKSSGGTNDWMTTYSDLVTLLFCFFVLLYSMSSVDAGKWKILVKSFNPDANQEIQEIKTAPGDGGTTDEQEEFEELYAQLYEYVELEGLGDDVEVTEGDGYTFITFRNNVFFDGDSYILKQEGKVILDKLCEIISGVSSSVQEIQVLGHTSQASPTEPNEISSDRFLSSNRATEVLVYMQKKNIMDPYKMVSSGFGQFRPISSFDTTESRAKNRRVEIIITKNDGISGTLDKYYEEVYGTEN
jgi:Flagellar motor protein